MQVDIFGLSSLEQRSLRGDLKEVYKIMKGVDKVNGHNLFPMVGEARRHGFKRRGEKLKRYLRDTFFTAL